MKCRAAMPHSIVPFPHHVIKLCLISILCVFPCLTNTLNSGCLLLHLNSHYHLSKGPSIIHSVIACKADKGLSIAWVSPVKCAGLRMQVPFQWRIPVPDQLQLPCATSERTSSAAG